MDNQMERNSENDMETGIKSCLTGKGPHRDSYQFWGPRFLVWV